MVKIVVPEQNFDWEGEWDSLRSYAEGDVVYREGSSYRATQASVGVDPVSGSGAWELVALKGTAGTSALRLEHRQDVAAKVWTITHNWGIIPSSVVVIDSAGTRVFGNEQFFETTVVVSFSAPFSGTAIVTA